MALAWLLILGAATALESVPRDEGKEEFVACVTDQQFRHFENEFSTLKATVDELSYAFKQMRAENEWLRSEYNSRGPRQNPIAFTVGLTVDVTAADGAIRVPYDLVLLNHGNAYDSNSHQFVAPVRGLYSFDISMGPIGYCMVALVVNGQYQAMASEEAVTSLAYSGDAVSVTVHLEAGDAAWVEMDHGSLHSGGDHGDWYPYTPRNTFSGYLYAEL